MTVRQKYDMQAAEMPRLGAFSELAEALRGLKEPSRIDASTTPDPKRMP